MTIDVDEAGSVAAELSRGDRLQPVLLIGSITVGLAIGSMAPAAADSLSGGVPLGVGLLIYFVMLGVGVGGFTGVLGQRRFLLAAVGVNFVVNPILAWMLGTTFLGDQPDLAVGLILFLTTPCIGWYLVFTELAGGDAELGVWLLGINVVLQLLLLPVYLWLFVGDATSFELMSITKSIAIYLALPGLAATLTRRWWAANGRQPDVEQARMHVPTLKTAALALVIVSMFASQSDTIIANRAVFLRLVPPLLVFFAVAFGTAIAVAVRIDLTYPQAALLAFTTTSRNSEASLAVAATAFTSPLVGLTVVLGPVVELPLLVLMVHGLRRAKERWPT